MVQQTETKPREPWYKIWWVWLIAAVILIGGIGSILEEDEPEQPPATAIEEPATETPEPVVEEQPAPEVEPAPEPEAEPEPEVALDETVAAQHLAYAWEDLFVYGGTVHWIMDRITTNNGDGTYTFKIGATIENEYGNKFKGTIEGDVAGTDDNPIITDSILYTDTGEILEYPYSQTP